MNVRFVVSVVVIFVLNFFAGFLVHGTLLHGAYVELTARGIYRPEADAQSLFGFMVLAFLVFAIGFTWIYRMGRENKPWVGQGLRFGIAVALLSTIPTYLIYYVISPVPSDVVAQQIVFDSIVMAVLGMVAAFVNRDPVPARA